VDTSAGITGVLLISSQTCIALRTMLIRDGVAYLQAGGGIVFDSDPLEEYEETINKLSELTCRPPLSKHTR
jgi:anthranilate/para-aminobenzoate synthase component I